MRKLKLSSGFKMRAPRLPKLGGLSLPKLPLKKRAGPINAPSRSITLQIRLENGQSLYWEVTSSGIKKVEAPTAGKVISFLPEDYRLASGPVTAQKAKALAIQETENPGPFRVVNQSKKIGMIYATEVARLDELTYQVIPGLQILDMLLLDNTLQHSHGSPYVAGFYFEGLAILYSFDVSGKAKIHLFVNPEDLDNCIAAITSQLRLADDTPAYIFEAPDLLGKLSMAAPYPAVPEWNGVPLATLKTANLVLLAIIATGTTGHAAYSKLRIQQAQSATKQNQLQISDTQKAISQMLVRDPSHLASLLSINTSKVFETAGLLWREGTTVSIDTGRADAKYTLISKVTKDITVQGNRPSSFAVMPSEQLKAILAIEPPNGCTKDGVYTTGGLNEVQVTVVCSYPNLGLDRFIGS